MTNLAAGETFGAAPKANVWVWAPPFFNGAQASAGIDGVMAHYNKLKNAPGASNKPVYGILNCSFGLEGAEQGAFLFPRSIKAALEAGIFVICAAGNKKVGNLAYLYIINFLLRLIFQAFMGPDYETCYMPESVEGVLLVGATNKNNLISEFSNYGPSKYPPVLFVVRSITAANEVVNLSAYCWSGLEVHLYAPGEQIDMIHGDKTIKRLAEEEDQGTSYGK